MRHRVRAAVLLENDNKILLVQHVDPNTGYTWWIPPGGGIEDIDNSVYECARRETFEETGLTVELGSVVYIREFVEEGTDTLHFELFFRGLSHTGELTVDNIHGNGPDEHLIKDVRWLSRAEMQHLVVFPEMLKDDFWDDLEHGFPTLRYLGRSQD